MKNHTKVFYFFLILLNYHAANAQNSFDSSYTNAVALYTKAVGPNANIFVGSEYVDFDHRIIGNPFFASLHFTNGSVFYDGVLYNNVEIFYDILNDDVVLKNYNGYALLLSKEKVGAFSFAGHNFIKIIADSTTEGSKTGYYEVLCNGNTKLFATRKKIIVEKIEIQYQESSFTEQDRYYILKNEIFYEVNDKKSVLNVLKDRKKELSKYIHDNKIKFKKNPEGALTKTVVYYNSLNNTK